MKQIKINRNNKAQDENNMTRREQTMSTISTVFKVAIQELIVLVCHTSADKFPH